jgi:hypothetical protein
MTQAVSTPETSMSFCQTVRLSQKTTVFILSAVRTWNLINRYSYVKCRDREITCFPPCLRSVDLPLFQATSTASSHSVCTLGCYDRHPTCRCRLPSVVSIVWISLFILWYYKLGVALCISWFRIYVLIMNRSERFKPYVLWGSHYWRNKDFHWMVDQLEDYGRIITSPWKYA